MMMKSTEQILTMAVKMRGMMKINKRAVNYCINQSIAKNSSSRVPAILKKMHY
jgi:hypothetical protein